MRTMSLRYNEKARRAQERRSVILHTLRSNPLAAGAAGATCIIGACVSIANALVLTAMLAVLLPLIAFISSVERERLGKIVRPAFYCFISALTVFLLSLFLDLTVAEGCVEALGIYAPLLAFDGLVLARTAEDAPLLTVRESLTESITTVICAAVIAIPIGAVREIFAVGKLFSKPVETGSVFSNPFFGFILCGFLLAAFRAAITHFAKEGR